MIQAHRSGARGRFHSLHNLELSRRGLGGHAIVASRQLANTWPSWNFVASTLSPIGRSDNTLPSAVLMTVIFPWGFRQPMKRPLFVSIDTPTGAAEGTGQRGYHLPRLDINYRDFVLVHQVDIDLTSPIGGRNSALRPDREGSIFPFFDRCRLSDISVTP